MEIQGFVEEIDYNELRFLEVVGRGAFGVVSRARWRNLDVAVKLIETESERKAFITELKQLSRINHPHIVKLYGACTKQPVCLVMEYAEGGSLYNVLHGASPVPKYTAAHAISWALQCARGVEYLHAMKPKALIHRDLKPPNLLLINGGTVLKICDFGTACDAHTHMTNNKGSAAWMAPEVFEGSNYSEKCDVFSWGIILWEVIARCKPFDEIGGSAFRVMWAVHSGKRPPLVKDCPKALETLMTRCWSANPVERPSMSEVVRIMSRLGQFVKGEDVPLLYPSRRDSTEDPSHRNLTTGGVGASFLHVDSRSSTIRATIQQPGTAFSSELVPQLVPVVTPRKPIVVEDNPINITAPSSRRASRDNVFGDVVKLEPSVAAMTGTSVVATTGTSSLPDASWVMLPTEANDAGTSSSHGPPPKPPPKPGHRRSGSQGNNVIVPSSSVSANTVSTGQLAVPNPVTLTGVTTAPGSLEDVERVLHNNVAARSVSWTPGLFAQGSGSAEDVRDAALNFIDPQIKPIPPCHSSPESVNIYHQHLRVMDDFLVVQAEISALESHKNQLLNELNLDEKVQLNRRKQEYEDLLTENEQLKLLFTNLQKQMALIKDQ
jgi:mitogen-activated protein kinase kinase kinase 7